uniref:Uncharacterized protein n=1 Tax=Ascaris lumbricoides TaxID=6252 RepID=A0A0M3IVA1_ASCLU
MVKPKKDTERTQNLGKRPQSSLRSHMQVKSAELKIVFGWNRSAPGWFDVNPTQFDGSGTALGAQHESK